MDINTRNCGQYDVSVQRFDHYLAGCGAGDAGCLPGEAGHGGRREVAGFHSPDTATVDGEGQRQRLIPWLHKHIDSGRIAGLEWINREEKLFKISWRNVSSKDWSEQDALIFKLWAKNTGRYEDGDEEDWPMWKTRLRVALNRLPGVRRHRHLDKTSAQDGEELYKVFQFVDKKQGNKADIDLGTRGRGQTEGKDVDAMVHAIQHMDVDEEKCPQTNDVNDERMDSDLRDIPSDDLMRQLNSTETRAALRQMDVDYLPDCGLQVTLKYCQLTALDVTSSNRHGCTIFSSPQSGGYRQHVPPVEADQVCFPDRHSAVIDARQRQHTLDILGAAQKGLHLILRDGDIYATRHCRARVYISSPSVKNGATIRLGRYVETKIFDVKTYFYPALACFIQGTGPRPVVNLVISFGQKFHNDRETVDSLLVSASVLHLAAYRQLTSVLCNPLAFEPEFSKSDPQKDAMCRPTM